MELGNVRSVTQHPEPEHSEAIIEIFLDSRDNYFALARYLEGLLPQLCLLVDIEPEKIETRVKDVESLRRKIEAHPTYESLTDVEDVRGARIIVFYESEVAKIKEMLKSQFDLVSEEEHGVENPEVFGYRSSHLTLRLAAPRRDLEENQKYRDLKFEVQVRTVLQHGWAAISHKLDYRSEGEVPPDVRRKLFAISALLRIGDELFDEYRRSVEELRTSYQSAVEAGDFADVSLDLISLHTVWDSLDLTPVIDVAIRAGFNGVFDSAPYVKRVSFSHLLTVLQADGLTNLGQLTDVIRSFETYENLLTRFVEASKRLGYQPVAEPADVIAIALILENESLAHLGGAYRDEVSQAITEIASQHGREPPSTPSDH